MKDRLPQWDQVHVSPDSALGLSEKATPRKEQALPEGSATPGGASRDIPKFEVNTPGAGANTPARTQGVPGEQYGHPTKYDYGTPTRRHMTSLLYEVYERGERTSPEEHRRLWVPSVPAEGSLGLEEYGDLADPPSSRVVPQGGLRKEAAKLSEIVGNTSSSVRSKASDVRASLRDANPTEGLWVFDVQGKSGTYTVRIEGEKKGRIKNLRSAQVKVSCTCPFFQWQGPEHWAVQNDYLAGEPRGSATKPNVKDPSGEHWACKHIVAAAKEAQKFRFASQDRVATKIALQWLNLQSR